MSRPELRAELEADLKKICAGEIRKEEVRERYIEKYRRIFLEAVQKASKWVGEELLLRHRIVCAWQDNHTYAVR